MELKTFYHIKNKAVVRGVQKKYQNLIKYFESNIEFQAKTVALSLSSTSSSSIEDDKHSLETSDASDWSISPKSTTNSSEDKLSRISEKTEKSYSS